MLLSADHIPREPVFLASMTALTGARPTALEMMTPRRGQKRVVSHAGAVDDIVED